jgi:mono/diheme cytochrome c family protein
MVMKSLALILAALLMAIFMQPAATRADDHVANGDATNGKALFRSLRCDSCHSVWGSGSGAEHPLPDLSSEPPVAIAAVIVKRGEPMSFVVSKMTRQQLDDVATYLHDASAAER